MYLKLHYKKLLPKLKKHYLHELDGFFSDIYIINKKNANININSCEKEKLYKL